MDVSSASMKQSKELMQCKLQCKACISCKATATTWGTWPALQDFVCFTIADFWCILIPSMSLFCGQIGLENNSEACGFVLFQYAPVSSHMDPFHTNFNDFGFGPGLGPGAGPAPGL